MTQRRSTAAHHASYQPAYAVPEPGPSRIHLSSANKVSSVYELGKGLFTPLSLPHQRQQPTSVRAEQIRRLLDLMSVCFERGDRARATRAWAILVRCHEVKPASQGWATIAQDFDQRGRHSQARTVAAMTDRLLNAVARGPVRDDLDYLETHITSFPFSEDPSLHVYAGLFTLYLGQEVASHQARQSSVESSTTTDTDMSSTTAPADAAAAAATGTSASKSRQQLVPIAPGYLSSAHAYFQTALKLYHKAKHVNSAPAVRYMKQLLRLMGYRDYDSDDNDSDNGDVVVSRHAKPPQEKSGPQEDALPLSRRRRLNLPSRSQPLEDGVSTEQDLLSRLTL